MNERKIKQLNILMIIVAITSFICVVLFSFVFAPNDNNRIGITKMKKLNESWIVKTYDNDTDRLVELPTKIKVKKGDAIVLVHTVPDDIGKDTVLMFDTYFQNVVVMLDNNKIYSSGVLNNQKMLKSSVPCINVVDLSSAKPGQLLTIYIASAYQKYSGKVGMIYYGTKGDVVSEIIYNNGLGIILSLIIMVVSIILLISLAFLKRNWVNKRRAFYAFVFVLLTSIWNISGNAIMQIFFKNNFGLYMTHMTILLILPMFYIMNQRCYAFKRRYAQIFEIGIYLFAINFLTGIVFQLMGICDYASYNIFTEVMIVLGLVLLSFIMYLAADTYKDEEIYSNFIGNSILAGSCILEGLFSLFDFYRKFDGSIVQLGLFVFLVMLLVAVEKGVLNEIDEENKQVVHEFEKEKNELTKQFNSALIYSAMSETINAIKDDDKEHSRLLYDTSVYMKYNLKTINNKGLVPFSYELEYIKAYLNMQKRMSSGIIVEIEDKVVDFMVPFNSIEPLVENAVINGALKSDEKGKIVFRCYERLDCFAIQIVDNGKGIGPDKHFTGVQDYKKIKDKLKAQCGAGIEIKTRTNKGTIVTVRIPKEGFVIKE